MVGSSVFTSTKLEIVMTDFASFPYFLVFGAVFTCRVFYLREAFDTNLKGYEGRL